MELTFCSNLQTNLAELKGITLQTLKSNKNIKYQLEKYVNPMVGHHLAVVRRVEVESLGMRKMLEGLNASIVQSL